MIGLKQNSNGKTGVVYVRTTGLNQHDDVVMEYVRWVMVRKRDIDTPAPETVVPDLPRAIAADQLVVPEGLNFTNYDFTLAGERHRWDDYEIGEQIDHVDGVTIEEAEHMMATRLWQNTAKVHFDTSARPDGSRLGDTVRAWSEVIDKAETDAPGVGAIRLRLVATKGGAPFKLKGADGKYLPEVLLDLDYWALIPT